MFSNLSYESQQSIDVSLSYESLQSINASLKSSSKARSEKLLKSLCLRVLARYFENKTLIFCALCDGDH